MAFVFTGQGAQYAQMGRQLYQLEPRFRAAIDRCAALMEGELGASLADILFGPSSAELLSDTRHVQPALFAIEYALADLLAHWGIVPDYVIGHSVGEIVAACVSGLLDLEGAVRFVVMRGRLMGQLPREGKMFAVEAPYAEVLDWIAGKEDEVSVAAVNGPTSVVVSGRAAAVDAIAQMAAAAGRRGKELEVSHAFHSPLMDPILSELSDVAASMTIGQQKIPLVANVTGDFHGDQVLPAYWSEHVRRPVLFHNGVRRLVEAGCSLFVEVGPQPALAGAMAASFDSSGARAIATLKRDRQDMTHILGTLASLHVTGCPLQLEHLFEGAHYRRVPLPLYPFRPDRHWVSAPAPKEKPLPVKQSLHPLIGQAVDVGARRAVFEVTMTASQPWVDHRVLAATVFPATAYLEMAARGFAAVNGDDWRSVVLRDVAFERPLLLAYGKRKRVTLTLDNVSTQGAPGATFVIGTADGPETFCRGRIEAADDTADRVSRDTEFNSAEVRVAIAGFYGELRKEGLEYGASFSTVRELWHGAPESGEGVGRITVSPHQETADHPFQTTVLLDGSLHVFGASLRTLSDAYRGAFIPTSVQSVTLRRPLPAQVWSHVSLRGNGDGRAAVARIRVVSDGGDVLAEIDGLELQNKSRFTAATVAVPAAATVSPARPTESRAELVARLRDLPPDDRVDAVVKWLSAEVKDIMGQAAEEIDFDELDPSMAFLEIGLDSLLVTELQRRIQEKLDFRFQPMQALDYQTIESLAEFIVNEVLSTSSPAAAADVDAATQPEPERAVST